MTNIQPSCILRTPFDSAFCTLFSTVVITQNDLRKRRVLQLCSDLGPQGIPQSCLQLSLSFLYRRWRKRCWGQREKTVFLIQTIVSLYFTINKQSFVQFRQSGDLKNSQNDSRRKPASPCWSQREKTVTLIQTVIPLYFTIEKQSCVQFTESGALNKSQNDSKRKRVSPPGEENSHFSKNSQNLNVYKKTTIFAVQTLRSFEKQSERSQVGASREGCCCQPRRPGDSSWLFFKAPDCLNCTNDCFIL